MATSLPDQPVFCVRGVCTASASTAASADEITVPEIDTLQRPGADPAVACFLQRFVVLHAPGQGRLRCRPGQSELLDVADTFRRVPEPSPTRPMRHQPGNRVLPQMSGAHDVVGEYITLPM